MMRRAGKILAGCWALAVTGGTNSAQPNPEGGGSLVRMEGGGYVDEDTVRTARETVSHSVTLPEWKNPRGFEKDVFTFARIIFWSDPARPAERGGFGGGPGGGPGGGRGFGGGFGGGRLGWVIDYPDADLNFSHRLQQLTSMKVDPDARVLKLTHADLPNYPFIYMEHIERMSLRPAEITALRRHLLAGGVLLVNDFWGALAWKNLREEIAKVLPERTWTELKKEHPIFHCVFDLRGPMSQLRCRRCSAGTGTTCRMIRIQIRPPATAGKAMKRCTCRRCSTTRGASWCWPSTTPTSATAGSAKESLRIISRCSPRRARIRWG
jgi:hypothetical protein